MSRQAHLHGTRARTGRGGREGAEDRRAASQVCTDTDTKRIRRRPSLSSSYRTLRSGRARRARAAVDPRNSVYLVIRRRDTRRINVEVSSSSRHHRAQSSPAPEFFLGLEVSAARADTRQRDDDFGDSFPRRARRQVARDTRAEGRRRGGGNSRGVKARETRYPPADGRQEGHEKVARQNCRAEVPPVAPVHRRWLLLLWNEIRKLRHGGKRRGAGIKITPSLEQAAWL